MALETSFPFRSVAGDRKYSAEDWAAYFAQFIGNGIFYSKATSLKVVTNEGMKIKVYTGAGFVNGRMYILKTDKVVALETADGVLNRIDRIVLRCDYVNRKIGVEVKKGSYGETPTAPDLTRNADIYELALADVYVAAGAVTISAVNITDQRFNTSLCGIVTGVVEQADTEELFSQFQAAFEEWFEYVKGELDEDVAGNLLAQVNTKASKDEVAVERARIDGLISLEEGTETTDVERELLDLKIKTDGTKAATAGDAVREQIGQLSSEIVDVSYNGLNVYSNVNMWEQGAIPNVSRSDRVRMNTYISSEVRKVKAEKGYLIGLYAYDTETETWFCWKGTEFGYDNLLYTNEIDMDYFRANYSYEYYKLVSKKEDNSTYSVSEANNISFVTRFDSLDLLNNVPNLKCRFPMYLLNTYIMNDGNFNPEDIYPSRVCDGNMIRVMNNDVIIKVSGDYAIRSVYKYNLNGGHIEELFGATNRKECVLPKGYGYRMTYCCNSDTTKAITPEEVYHNISMYNYTDTDKSFDILRNEFENAKKIFSNFASSGKHFNVKMVGDSILHGVNGSGFNQNGEKIITSGSNTWLRNPNGYCWGNLFKSLLESKYDCTVVNNACRGTHTSFLIQNWNSLVSNNDDLLICCYGTNDRGFTPNQTDFLNNLLTIKALADKWDIKVIFVSGIPAGLQNELCQTNNYDNIYYHMEDVDRLISKATNGNYVSLYNKVHDWLSYSDKELTDYLDEYELHPTDELYYKMFVWVCGELGIAPKIKNATW